MLLPLRQLDRTWSVNTTWQQFSILIVLELGTNHRLCVSPLLADLLVFSKNQTRARGDDVGHSLYGTLPSITEIGYPLL